MAINSRAKGCRAERALAKKLNEYGYKCRRGQRNDKGQFVPNENRWFVRGNLLYCYLGDELLFFTEKKNWYLLKGKSFSKIADGYSSTRIDGRIVLVHRLLTHAPETFVVDHINRNKRDNRLENLRITDKSENAFNSKTRVNNTSGVSGVWFRKDTNKWVAEIKKDYKKISLGCYATKEEAIEARKKVEEEIYGYQL